MASDTRFGTWEAAVVWLRDQPDRRQLVLDAFYDDPLIGAAERYHSTSEWQAVSRLLLGRTGLALDVGAGRGIASYALAVRPETDAAVLAQVMPETQVLNLPGDQVAGFFDRVKSDTRAAKARAVLRPDLSQPVQVSWRPADLAGLDLRRGTATTVVSLSATTTRVPLTLSSLAVRSRGVDVQAVGLPDTLTLAPGATTALPLTL